MGAGELSVKCQFVKTEGARYFSKSVLSICNTLFKFLPRHQFLGYYRVGKDNFNRDTIITEEIIRAKESNRSTEP